MTVPAWLWMARHYAALLVGLAAFMLVYLYTGDADLLFAVGSGLGASVLLYTGMQLHRLCHG